MQKLIRNGLTSFREAISIDALNRVSDELHERLVLLEYLDRISHINDKIDDLQESESNFNGDALAEEDLSLQPKT